MILVDRCVLILLPWRDPVSPGQVFLHPLNWIVMAETPLPMEVTCRQVAQKLADSDDFLLLDCREPNEHEIVSITAALLLPMSQLMARQAELTPHQERSIIVHCHHGGRSLQVAAWLRKQGFAQAQSMAGGIDAWAVDISPELPRY
jgi:rhodanese-related sulfurtransferase